MLLFPVVTENEVDSHSLPANLNTTLEPQRAEERLEAYAALHNVVAVREHLGWDAGNALRRWNRNLAPWV